MIDHWAWFRGARRGKALFKAIPREGETRLVRRDEDRSGLEKVGTRWSG